MDDAAARDEYSIRTAAASKRSKLVAGFFSVVNFFMPAGTGSGMTVLGTTGVEVVERTTGRVVLHLDEDVEVGPSSAPNPASVYRLLVHDLDTLSAAEFRDRWGIESEATEA